MLVMNEEANNLQYSLFNIYYESRDLLECVRQFKFIMSDNGWNEIDSADIYLKYPKLLSSTIFSLKYSIIVGTAKLFDTDHRCITIEKLLNQSEQLKLEEYNKFLNKVREEMKKYENLKKYINLLRDKIYAHTDKKFNEENDKYDFVLSNEDLEKLDEFLNWTLDICVNISVIFDNDKLNLKMSRDFDLKA